MARLITVYELPSSSDESSVKPEKQARVQIAAGRASVTSAGVDARVPTSLDCRWTVARWTVARLLSRAQR